MKARLEIQKAAPQAYRAMLGVESYLKNTGLEPTLLELVACRAD